MDPLTIGLLLGLIIGAAAGGGGAAAAHAIASNNSTARQAEATRDTIREVMQPAQTDAESAANVADQLVATPAPCLPDLGGDPMSPQCMAALCMRTGESKAQRCTQLDDLLEATGRRWEADLETSCPEVADEQ